MVLGCVMFSSGCCCGLLVGVVRYLGCWWVEWVCAGWLWVGGVWLCWCGDFGLRVKGCIGGGLWMLVVGLPMEFETGRGRFCGCLAGWRLGGLRCDGLRHVKGHRRDD